MLPGPMSFSSYFSQWTGILKPNSTGCRSLAAPVIFFELLWFPHLSQFKFRLTPMLHTPDISLIPLP
jgi:hypothetical protein